MNSKEIADWIGKRVWLRKLGFHMIFWTTLREWYIKRGLDHIISRSGAAPVVLDAGCGMGQHLYYCAKNQPQSRVVGLDWNEQHVKDLNDFLRRCHVQNALVVCSDLSTWQADETYDIVLCGSVLEHLEDDRTVLQKISACMKPSGHLLIYVPSAEKRVLKSLEKKMAHDLNASGKKYPHDHVRYYTPSELAEKLEQVGFKILDEKIAYGPWGRWAYDLVTLVQFSRIFKWIFPFYLILIHPFVLVLMWRDISTINKNGNGLLMIARKS